MLLRRVGTLHLLLNCSTSGGALIKANFMKFDGGARGLRASMEGQSVPRKMTFLHYLTVCHAHSSDNIDKVSDVGETPCCDLLIRRNYQQLVLNNCI